ncbi:hypothetical protein CABS01_04546 [Colletotrichum abscissum]|uniref:uncharacterized protein n=1 Tax=Colletotrichum abscissum TaxID=1671311 RepID=UPI0027D6B92B|nr:uncharacterized protein CABS01_04546 [Colletotrichum abscissum]KAK1471903.1 hypothetical protein CABS01_04546 [Colletotrichum abscissum]
MPTSTPPFDQPYITLSCMSTSACRVNGQWEAAWLRYTEHRVDLRHIFALRTFRRTSPGRTVIAPVHTKVDFGSSGPQQIVLTHRHRRQLSEVSWWEDGQTRSSHVLIVRYEAAPQIIYGVLVPMVINPQSQTQVAIKQICVAGPSLRWRPDCLRHF